MPRGKYSVTVVYKSYSKPSGETAMEKWWKLLREVESPLPEKGCSGVYRTVLESPDYDFLEDLAQTLNSRHMHD